MLPYKLLNMSFDLAREMLPFGERLEYALQVSLIGIIAVFGALTLIMLILKLMKVVMDLIDKAKTKGNKKRLLAASSADTAELQPERSDDGELIAVITAAVAATLSEENKKSTDPSTHFGENGFKVVSFKRIGSNNKKN